MNIDLIKLFKIEVSFLEFINCLGCESQKPHTHTYYPGEYNLVVINKLLDNKQISQQEAEWLKQCYLKEN